MIQTGYPFDEFTDFTALRLASLHTVVNPWIYPLVRRKYREGFWYLLELAAHYLTCTLVAKPETTLGKIRFDSVCLLLFCCVYLSLCCSNCILLVSGRSRCDVLQSLYVVGMFVL